MAAGNGVVRLYAGNIKDLPAFKGYLAGGYFVVRAVLVLCLASAGGRTKSVYVSGFLAAL